MNIWNEIQFFVFLGIGLVAVLFVLNRVKKRVVANLASTPSKLDDIVVPWLFKLIRWVIYYIVLVMGLQHFGVKFSIVEYLGAFFGMAVAMNSKGAISWAGNIFTVTFFKPFKEGDFREFKALGVEGTIVDIGWFQVLLYNDNKEVVEIPLALALKGIRKRPATKGELDEWGMFKGIK